MPGFGESLLGFKEKGPGFLSFGVLPLLHSED